MLPRTTRSPTVTAATCGGLSCSFCTSTITRAVRRLPGVDEVAVSLAHEGALVRYDGARMAPQAIVDAIRDVRYTVRDPRRVRGLEEEEEELRRELDHFRLGVLVTVTGLGLMVALWTGHRIPIVQRIVLALTVIQIFFIGRHILDMAIPSVRVGILNQHFLALRQRTGRIAALNTADARKGCREGCRRPRRDRRQES